MNTPQLQRIANAYRTESHRLTPAQRIALALASSLAKRKLAVRRRS